MGAGGAVRQAEDEWQARRDGAAGRKLVGKTKTLLEGGTLPSSEEADYPLEKESPMKILMNGPAYLLFQLSIFLLIRRANLFAVKAAGPQRSPCSHPTSRHRAGLVSPSGACFTPDTSGGPQPAG